MSAGFKVITDNNIVQVDENYSNLYLSRTIKLSSLGQVERTEYYVLDLESNERLVAIYVTNNALVVQEPFYNQNISNRFYFWLCNGKASDVTLYVFGEKKQSNGNSGLQIFNERGECIFDSNFKPMTVSHFGTNYNSVTFDSNRKYAICAFGYNLIIAEMVQPNGIGYFFHVPYIRNGVLTVDDVKMVNGTLNGGGIPQYEWGRFNMFSYLVVDVTDY